MERLRRKIELYRQHQINCESRYEKATVERLELERQQTVALHQRCLQTKAKRASKHRQPPPSSDQAGQRAAPASTDHGENGGMAPEQSRNSTLMALQETVKRKLESAGSPLSRDQANGYGEGYPPNKKPSLDNGTPNGPLLDSKRGISNLLNFNGTNGGSVNSADSVQEGDLDFHRKEMKQEPEDILPIMPPSVGGSNSLIPDLNLNEQEWKELMEELNCTVPIEDIQDILNNGFEDRKDPLELAPSPTGGGVVGGAAGARGGSSSKGLIPPDLVSVKAEFSPASAAFEQDSHMGSPHVRSTPSGPLPHPTSSPVASSAPSPALSSTQSAPPPRPHHLPPPGPPVSKDLSPAQQLQQLAAQRTQHLHSSLQPQMGANFHNQGHQSHPPPWTQMVTTSQGPLVGSFGMEKPKSPSTYSQDFSPNAPKQLLMPPQQNKGSPKAGGGYLQRPNGPPRMMNQLSSGSQLSHPQTSGSQVSSQMLNYSNTEPLRHFEMAPTPQRPPNTQSKAAILQLVRQQHMKPHSMGFRQHGPHAQDQNNYPTPPHGPANVSGNNPCAAQPAANSGGGNHGNAPYLNSQAAVAAALKQQILEQQKKQQILQRQQLMAEQEKRQQDQQLQRHLTRPPPQYQDQPGPPANQNQFPQQQVGQFPASSQPMGNCSSMGVTNSSSRVFSQSQSMMGMTMGQGAGPGTTVAPPTAASQADINLPSCGGGSGGGVDTLYNNMNLQHGLQRQQMGPMSAPFRQSLLGQQQHLKQQPNVAMLKQQQLAAARMPSTMQSTMGGGLQGQMQGGQSATWQQQQLANQPASGNATLPPSVFNNPSNAFHMQQQQRIPKMSSGSVSFASNLSGLPMTGLNPGQQMIQTNMAAQQRAPPPAQNMGQPLANQQQAQQQQANQSLSDMVAFGQQVSGRPGLQCNQGYQMSRAANQQQQQVSFGYNAASGSFAAESELVDSLLKGQEWIAELDALLANHQ